MLKTLRKASCGTSTDPIAFMRFLPAFVFQGVCVYEKRHHRNTWQVTFLRRALISVRATIFVAQ